MGPTNVALVRYYQADQELRAAKARLDAASKDVRVQERRVNDLAEKQRLAQQKLKESQARAANLELDLRSRDAHVEKLRTRQADAKNNKEYQSLLVEINTQKVDRNKVEDETMKMLEQVERGNRELTEIVAQHEQEKAKLHAMREQIGGKLAEIQKEVDDVQPRVTEAGAGVPVKAREVFDKLNERMDGEPMAPIAKPDRRREEYVCTACNMDLVVDIYNKLHSRDELIFCPSCRRLLYIPADLPPEVAVKGKSSSSGTTRRSSAGTRTSRAGAARAKAATVVRTGDPVFDELTRVLTKAAGESVRNAVAAGNEPVECEVSLDGRFIGVFKGQSPDNLARTARFCLQETGVPGMLNVVPKRTGTDAAPGDGSSTEAQPADTTSPEATSQPGASAATTDDGASSASSAASPETNTSSDEVAGSEVAGNVNQHPAPAAQ